MKDCLFCKIISGEEPSVKIWEDENFVAVLDLFPNAKGNAFIMPKKHYDSYVFDMPEDVYSQLMLAARKVAKLLEKGLKVKRVAMVMEGMGINHAHVKFYPIHGVDEKFKEIWGDEKVYFENYKGYITTQIGEKASFEELKSVAAEIKKNNDSGK